MDGCGVSRLLLREDELLVLLQRVIACGEERWLQAPGLVVLITAEVCRVVPAHHKLGEVVEEVLHPHAKDAIVFVPPVDEAIAALVDPDFVIRT